MSTMPQFLDQLNSVLDEYLVKKAPALPENIKEAIVKYGPYLIIVGLVLSVPSLLLVLGIGAVAAPLVALGGVNTGAQFTFGILVSFVSLILQALSLPGLFKRSLSGWNFSYYSALISAIANLISFNLGGLVIGALISFYILFQIKSYYK